MKLIRVLLLMLVMPFWADEVSSQQYPPPVDLPIQNLRQESPVWCWAAVAQQIVMFANGAERTPPQCALVAMANRAHPVACCGGYNQACLTTGSIQQIQWLIAQFGGRYSSYAPPADAMTLYQTLASGRPIIAQLRTGQTSAHVVVIRGMSFIQTQVGVQPVLHINDPLAYFTQPVLFQQIVPVWMSAIVVN
jgi:Papain-like cysteine protease AvrRpt2